MRLNMLLGTALLSAVCVASTTAQEIFRDDFDNAWDHTQFGGSVAPGSIWNGVLNANNGGGSFASGGGELTMGISNTGWEGGGRDDARFIYRNVDASQLASVTTKISSQTQGFWSNSGIMVRVPGPVDADGSNDDLVTASAFAVGIDDTGAPRGFGTGYAVQANVVVGGVEAETNVSDLTPDDLMWLRIENQGGGDFEIFSSNDGSTWASRGIKSNPAMAAGALQVGVWGGTFGELADASTSFDWVEIRTVPEPTSMALGLSAVAIWSASAALRRRQA
ncbi:MAG: hypothetical protein R3E01_18495 [Pirellulaceae bacterium]|nr:hypothetical protein [Planctomycetales bacterium]